MSDFNFNERGIYELKLEKDFSEQVTPDWAKLSQTNGSMELIVRNDEIPKKRITSNIIKRSNQRTWNVSDSEQNAITDAFHYAGLFFEKLFPHFKDKEVIFYRSEHSVTMVVGDETFSSTYNATKTFKNPYLNGRECTELNFRLLKDNDPFTKTLHYALRAMENMTHNKPSENTADESCSSTDITRPLIEKRLTA